MRSSGVSCLSVLERAFPYMEAAAIPGIAIPLLQDDCKDTAVDVEWVWEVIHLDSDDQTRRLDLEATEGTSAIMVQREESRRNHGSRGERNRSDRPRVAGPRWQTLASVSDGMRVSRP